MNGNRLFLRCAALLLLVMPAAASGTEMIEQGTAQYLLGNLDGALQMWSGELTANPQDAHLKELVGNALVILGKQSLLQRKYREAYDFFERAVRLFPDRKELRSLFLLADLERAYPTPVPVHMTGTLSATDEKSAIFNIVFGGRSVPPQQRFVVHTVQGGETLGTIAVKYYKDFDQWQRIMKKNPHLKNPHRIFPGLKLIIPLP